MSSNDSLGYVEVKKLEAEGWRFSDDGLRVGNGWLVWAENPRGDFKILLLAHPDDEPEKFPNLRTVPAVAESPEQPMLAL